MIETSSRSPKHRQEKRLESMLADVIPEKPLTMSPPQDKAQQEQDRSSPQKVSISQVDKEQRTGSLEPIAMMYDIAMNLRNTKKSVQYEHGKNKGNLLEIFNVASPN